MVCGKGEGVGDVWGLCSYCSGMSCNLDKHRSHLLLRRSARYANIAPSHGKQSWVFNSFWFCLSMNRGDYALET